MNQTGINKFADHLQQLQKNYSLVLPGELSSDHLSICLTFDDAYLDFYQYIFPLLKQFKIPAVLAIPAGLIEENHHASWEDQPLCNWQQIREMIATGLVYPASHSLNHINLNNAGFAEAFRELKISKQVIEKRLQFITEVFVYPFGAFNQAVTKIAAANYKYLMRIGGALNKNWQQKILYRVDADQIWRRGDGKINQLDLIKWQLKYYLNRLRGR